MIKKAEAKNAPVRDRFLLAAREAAWVYKHGPHEARLIDDETADQLRPLLGGLERFDGNGGDGGFVVSWALDSGSPLGTWWWCLSCDRLDEDTLVVSWDDNLGTGEVRPEVLGFGRGPDLVRSCAAVVFDNPPSAGSWDPELAEESAERLDSDLSRIQLYRIILAMDRCGEDIITSSDEELAQRDTGTSRSFDNFCRIYFGG